MLPRHIAIIMDGNRRWAERHHLPTAEGHQAGVQAAGRIARAVVSLKIPYLTLYALSTENLNRSAEELHTLARLVHQYLEEEVPSLLAHRIRLKVIGSRELLSPSLAAKIAQAEKMTREGDRLFLTLALGYGGRDEIVRAVRRLLATPPARLTERTFALKLDTAGQPDPDLLIRTGGDFRLSNFLLWQSAYTELYFTRTLWPDFRTRHLKTALAAYQRRERRFGRREPGARPSPCRPRRFG